MRIISLLTTLLFLSGCSIFRDDKLSIPKAEYSGSQLKINGYYYDDYDPSPEGYIDVYFLFQNGVILNPGAFKKSKISEDEARCQTAEFHNILKEGKHHWGVFKIEGNTIEFERWYPGEGPAEAWIRSGVILNDTTFQITKSWRAKKKQRST